MAPVKAAAATAGEPEPTVDVAESNEELSRQVTAAQQRMARAIAVGKLKNDPLADLAHALAETLGVQHQIHCATVRLHREASVGLGRQLRAALEAARQPVDPAALVRLEKRAATGADRQAAKLARAHNWRTVLIAATVIVGSIGAGAVGGLLFERQAQLSTEAGITAEAFRSGPDAAAAWLALMRSNDIVASLSVCKGRAVIVSDGRHACGIAI